MQGKGKGRKNRVVCANSMTKDIHDLYKRQSYNTSRNKHDIYKYNPSARQKTNTWPSSVLHASCGCIRQTYTNTRRMQNTTLKYVTKQTQNTYKHTQRM